MTADPMLDLTIPLDQVEVERAKLSGSQQKDEGTGPEPLAVSQLPAIVWSPFAQRYLDLVGPCTEAPAEFHLAALITAVGCLIGRRCWVSLPHATYPNFYTLLLGDTSDTRKTTAYRFGVDLLRGVSERLNAKVKTLFGLASVEGLALAMKDGDSPEPYRILAIEDEFKALVTKGHQKGVSNLIPRLVELYNTLPKFEVNTKNDRIEVCEPFLSLLSSSTEAWFSECISESEVSGGFLNRCTVFSGRSDRLIPLPEPVADENWRRFLGDLSKTVERAEGRYVLAEDAKGLYSEFYQLFRSRKATDLAREATSRGHLHAIKFALVYAVLARHAVIEAEDIKRGIALAVHCANVAESLAEVIGQTRIGKQEQKLLRALGRGRLSAREAMRRLGWSADQLDRVARGLQRAALVDIVTDTSGAGRRRVFIESRE